MHKTKDIVKCNIFQNTSRILCQKRRRLRISDNFPITRVVISYRTDSQKVQNRFLYA